VRQRQRDALSAPAAAVHLAVVETKRDASRAGHCTAVPHHARRASPLLRLLLPAAVLLPVAIMGMGAWIAWNSTWDQARAELTHTADAAAEYAASVLDLHRSRAARVNEMLRGLSDEDMRAREAELHATLRGIFARDGMGDAFRLYVFDRFGRVLLNTDLVPSPPGSYADRGYFAQAARPGAPAAAIGEVQLGRANGRLFFPVTLLREGTGNGLPPGEFDGLINVSVAPEQMGSGLKRLRGAEQDVLSLVRTDGAVLARTRPVERDPPWRQEPGSEVAALMQGGVSRFERIGPSPLDGAQRLVAYRRVADWPVYVSAARGRAAILARWQERVVGLLAIGVPATLALALLALAVRRAQRSAEAARQGLEARVAERTAELARRSLELAASESRFRLALEAADMGAFEIDFRTGVIERSARSAMILGIPSGAATSTYTALHARVHEADRRTVTEGLEALRDGRSDRYAVQFRFQRPDGAWVWIESRARPVETDRAGRPVRVAGTLQDVTARREAEERRALLAREVDHRAKNALAVVQAALRLTPRHDADGFATAVEGRIASLARAHTLLAQQSWAGAELRRLLEGELAAFLPDDGQRPSRAELNGPEVQVAPAAAQSLSLTCHELATNAVKYGALSAPDGRLLVRWVVDAEAGVLRLDWVESGGPVLSSPPSRRGFGSRLIAATVRDQLGGWLEQSWGESGLVVRMAIPLDRLAAGGASAPDSPETVSAL
jgi:PAS domain S-box-containing protein